MSLSPPKVESITVRKEGKPDTTLTIEELLKAHSSLKNHNQTCEKQCLLAVLNSLSKPTVVKEGEVVRFD